jgi:hypothetical protein
MNVLLIAVSDKMDLFITSMDLLKEIEFNSNEQAAEQKLRI